MDKEDGFSLIELLVIMGLVAILMTLGAFAARQFWFQRSLVGGQDQVVTQLRALQQRVVAEGITTRWYGAWFNTTAATDHTWGIVRYDSVANSCLSLGSFQFDAGVEVSQVDFADTVSGTSVATAITTCRNLSTIPDASDLAFFLSRGTATESTSNLQLNQPRLGRTEEIRILSLTGRAEKI